MVMSRLFKVFLLVALCVPLVSKADAPVANTGWFNALTSRCYNSVNNFGKSLARIAPSKYTIGAALAIGLFFGAPAIAQKIAPQNDAAKKVAHKNGSTLKNIREKLSSVKKYVTNTATTWGGWLRSFVYAMYDAPANVQGAVYETTNTFDPVIQHEVFGDKEKISLPNAIAEGDIEAVKSWLKDYSCLETQALIEDAEGENRGRTGAMIAAKHAQCNIFALFLRQTNVNQVDNEGKTALHWAIIGENDQEITHRSSIIKQLVNAWADLHIADDKGKTPFMCLAESKLDQDLKKSTYARDFFEAFKNSVDRNPARYEAEINSALKLAEVKQNKCFIALFLQYFGKSLAQDQKKQLQDLINEARSKDAKAASAVSSGASSAPQSHVVAPISATTSSISMTSASGSALATASFAALGSSQDNSDNKQDS
jgi:hypothetical protein